MNSASVNAYWLRVSGPRDEYADFLREQLRDTDTTVVVVRSGGFDNPNSLMQDLARLINHHREHLIDFVSKRQAPLDRFGMVLLARSELRIPQTSSPVIWPEWMPGVGGREVSCFIRDISRSVDVGLDSAELGLERLNRGAYDLEWALLRRLTAVGINRPGEQHDFWEIIRNRDERDGLRGFLESVSRSLSAEGTTESYRPTGRGSRSICGRLWVRVQSREPRAIAPLALALAKALDLDAASPSQIVLKPNLFTVLSRPGPTAQDAPYAELLARDILVATANACQMITCAAHAGDYGKYPIGLLQGIVDELHRGLSGLEALLNTLPRAG